MRVLLEVSGARVQESRADPYTLVILDCDYFSDRSLKDANIAVMELSASPK